ncbi:acyl-coenzyme A amino acid N-acyltransferase 1-like [Haliotis rufescens]|uniref:acyl-coenzyme A amino acid N-acyltransferase 1-like n=1 Tax=Haliotis rufescens TaxID=6454 RepID=UPI00201F2951|nr:acyl-coenzyme A amino acid N-acyltransferase 1-like [Haliotis rufescens]
MACHSIRAYTSPVRRLHVIGRALSSHTSSPTLLVEPSDALIDEPLTIRVSGLKLHQKITLSAFLRAEGKEFVSCAHYTADDAGCVDTAVHSSGGGSFYGVEPMGLLWSMTPSKDKGAKRLLIKDVTRPYDVTMSVHADHMDLEAIKSANNISTVLDTQHVRRWYLRNGVQRIPVRKGRLRGTLFIPSGVAPYPAVLDMFGGSGGLFEFRAALLASRGFLTFALAYLAFDGLPRNFDELDFDYFMEAVEMLSGHLLALPGGIGVIGSSFGGGLTNMLASFCDKVKAAVVINGPPTSPLRDQDVNGERIIGHIPRWNELSGDIILNYDHSDVLPMWRQGAKILHLVSEDDQVLPSSAYRSLMQKIPGDKKHNIQSVFYPGAGHLLEPPFAPLCRESSIKIGNDTLVIWGGDMQSHAVAQENSWKRILEHLNTHLSRISM